MALYDSPHGNPFESSQERIKHLSAQIAAKTAQLQSHERATQEFSRAISERSHQVDQLKVSLELEVRVFKNNSLFSTSYRLRLGLCKPKLAIQRGKFGNWNHNWVVQINLPFLLIETKP